MKHMKVFLSFFLIVLVSCKTKNTEVIIKNETPKNVILLIADGTGLSQISSAFYYKETTPNYERFKHVGLIKTPSSRQDITDSAAGATAFASGVKTYNGAIGVADDSTAVSTIIEIAALNKIKSGVVATSSVVHATPASFYAHAFKRSFYEEIAADLVASEVDFFAGGGIKFFNKRLDGLDLIQNLRAKEFNIDTTALGDFNSIKEYEKVGYLLAADGMPKVSEGRGDYLTKATELGIQFLNKDKQNFFLMVEGSQVDWGGHSNDADYLISELIDFDDAVGAALDFAEKDGNTLVVVTADHETGGFTLSSTLKSRADGTSFSDYSEITPTFSTGGHSATLIPVFAYGPGAAEFSGIYENTEIFHKIIALSGWKE